MLYCSHIEQKMSGTPVLVRRKVVALLDEKIPNPDNQGSEFLAREIEPFLTSLSNAGYIRKYELYASNKGRILRQRCNDEGYGSRDPPAENS